MHQTNDQVPDRHALNTAQQTRFRKQKIGTQRWDGLTHLYACMTLINDETKIILCGFDINIFNMLHPIFSGIEYAQSALIWIVMDINIPF